MDKFLHFTRARSIGLIKSLLTVILLLICTCTYVRSLMPNLFDKRLGKVGVSFGNVLGLVRGKVPTWLFAASLWPLVYYSGRKIPKWVGYYKYTWFVMYVLV